MKVKMATATMIAEGGIDSVTSPDVASSISDLVGMSKTYVNDGAKVHPSVTYETDRRSIDRFSEALRSRFDDLQAGSKDPFDLVATGDTLTDTVSQLRVYFDGSRRHADMDGTPDQPYERGFVNQALAWYLMATDRTYAGKPEWLYENISMQKSEAKLDDTGQVLNQESPLIIPTPYDEMRGIVDCTKKTLTWNAKEGEKQEDTDVLRCSLNGVNGYDNYSSSVAYFVQFQDGEDVVNFVATEVWRTGHNADYDFVLARHSGDAVSIEAGTIYGGRMSLFANCFKYNPLENEGSAQEYFAENVKERVDNPEAL